MAADRASQHNCTYCQSDLLGTPNGSVHLCSHCGKPQPIRPDETFFSALGLEPRLQLDTLALEKRFYEISRNLHPDRFTTSDPESRRISMERMTFVNDGYRTLKNPSLRRAYFLKLTGYGEDPQADIKKKSARIPADLAESWFELQDALMESPDEAAAKLRAFEAEFAEFRSLKNASMRQLESDIDEALAQGSGISGGIASLATRLLAEVQSESYLESMSADIERIKKRYP